MHSIISFSTLFVAVAILATANILLETSAFTTTPPTSNYVYNAKCTPLYEATSSSIEEETTTQAVNNNENKKKRKKLAVLLCPAQFCVPVDYIELLDTIQLQHTDVDIVATRVAPLPRTEWIKVAKQLPTKDFIDANLSVKRTLDWYFDAIEEGLAELFTEEDAEVCLLGHSIGGWIARAYLGGLSGSSTAVYRHAQDRISSLVTIGTPHISPESALVDQTRGLLREIESSAACSTQSLTDRGVKITCVGSSGLAGKLFTTDLEEIIAATSYLPLLGSLNNVRGDGIVPLDLAFMEGARRVEIEKCMNTDSPVRHAHVLPTPWNLLDGSAPSLKLPNDIVWYGSSGVLEQWLEYLE